MRNKKELLLVIAGAVVVALAALVLSPVLAKNALFLAALPFAAIVFILLVLNVRHLFIFIILTRAFMDPILMKTKLGEGSGGIGGVLNLFVIMMVAFLVAKRPKVLSGNKHMVPWVIFVVWAFCTAFSAEYPNRTIKLMINICTYLAMFVAPFYLVNDEKDKKFWVKMILFSTFIPAMAANAGIVTKLPLLNAGGRLTGLFTHANILAFYTLFAISFVFYVLKTRILRLSQPMRIALWLYIVNWVVILVVTQTRSAWMAFAGIFFLYSVMKERKMLWVFAIVLPMMLALPQVQERLKDLTHGTGKRYGEALNSWAWRVKLWKNATPYIQKKILTGYGVGSFEHESRQFYTEGPWGTPAHNVYLEVLFETGIFGFLAFLAIYLAILRTLFRRIRQTTDQYSMEAAIVFCYLTGYLVTFFSDNMMYYLAFNWYVWFFLGVILRGINLKKNS